jgi:8-hydroxy-5-deazaflavin:NADPH oxidoreductase
LLAAETTSFAPSSTTNADIDQSLRKLVGYYRAVADTLKPCTHADHALHILTRRPYVAQQRAKISIFNRRRISMPKHDPVDRGRRALIGGSGALIVSAGLWPARALAQTASKISIGVIGSGHIGGTIGGLWVKAGHPVLFSSRHPGELKDLVAGLGELAKAGTVDQAIAFGDVLFIAVPYAALPQIGQDFGAALKGKIMLDACNAVAARDGGPIADEVEREGIGVVSQKYLSGARLVRAFNTLNYKILASEANRPDPKLAIPIAGNDPEAVQTGAGLVRDAGFDPVIVGKLADASRFQRGGPGYGQAVSAAELKQKLSLTP